MSERVSMRKVREVLRLKFECGRSHAEIAASVAIGETTVGDYLARARAAGLAWAEARLLSDAEVEGRLFHDGGRNEPPSRVPIDFAWVHRELSRPAVTLQTLWVEYRDGAMGQAPLKAYEYSRFCALYAQWKKKLSVVMRQVHRAGEKMFIDYSGRKPHVVHPSTGEVYEVELFVAVLGASNYTYAEATRTQKVADFVGSTIRAFEYFGCVPEVVVPDQLRSAVSGPDRYEPDINPTYLEMAQHYGVTVIPARPRKPRDKAKVEGGVLIAQRWILAALRNRTFFSPGELNVAVRELLEQLNKRPFQKLEGCRHSAFETIDKPAMRPLPAHRYQIAKWRKVKVNIDYCVDYEHRLYSVPYTMVGAEVEIRATATSVEILHQSERVASHVRSYGPKGTAVICDEHRPREHRDYGKWPPERVVAWAESIGDQVGEFARRALGQRTHPETGYRTCLGVIRLADRYGKARVNAACARALSIGSPTCKSVTAILKNGLDRAPRVEPPTRAPIAHEHIRGASYFDTEDERDPGRNDSEARRDEAARDGTDGARDARVSPDGTPLH
ncbi:IS21 family transposase [Pendulispora albinea]|uniref:IS21 family transposase n=1 Tax=Pendulispora albinea TaxID=2741071 RepID=A0ABZ2M2H8_9BACT